MADDLGKLKSLVPLLSTQAVPMKSLFFVPVITVLRGKELIGLMVRDVVRLKVHCLLDSISDTGSEARNQRPGHGGNLLLPLC